MNRGKVRRFAAFRAFHGAPVEVSENRPLRAASVKPRRAAAREAGGCAAGRPQRARLYFRAASYKIALYRIIL